MASLTDKSKMPYGKHKGRLMGDVPAKDLLWLYDNNKAFQGVREYVDENKQGLMLEAYPKRRK